MEALPKATATTLAQREVELSLLRFLRRYNPEVYALWSMQDQENDSEDIIDESENNNNNNNIGINSKLCRELHSKYVQYSLMDIAESSQGLYCAQPWLVYWALQAADVLDVTDELYEHVPPNALGEFLLSCLHEVNIVNNNNNCYFNNENNGMPIDSIFSRYSNKVVEFQNDDGERLVGFAGGRLAQVPHLAASYAAVCSLCILSEPSFLQSLPRAAIKRWLLSLRREDGSFAMHVGGEADIRASYCVAVIVVLLQLAGVVAFRDGREEAVLTPQTAAFVALCQTHEGGFACGQFASEAHGAYTQCGLGALMLMQQPHLCNYPALRRWLAARQMKFEGGFNGRTNKLVDSCYSHWVGASHVLLQVGEAYTQLLGCASTPRTLTARETLLLDHAQLLDVTGVYPVDNDAWFQVEKLQQQRAARVEQFLQASSSSSSLVSKSFLDEDVGDFYFNQRRLLLYVLSCCQERENGGLMDKPDCPNDAYHTCYSLSGMSSAQNLQYLPRNSLGDHNDNMYALASRRGYIPTERDNYGVVLLLKKDKNFRKIDSNQNRELLRPMNPIFNIQRKRVLSTLRVWGVKSFLC